MEGLVLKSVESHVEIQDMENHQDMEIVLDMEVKHHTLYYTTMDKIKQLSCRSY